MKKLEMNSPNDDGIVSSALARARGRQMALMCMLSFCSCFLANVHSLLAGDMSVNPLRAAFVAISEKVDPTVVGIGVTVEGHLHTNPLVEEYMRRFFGEAPDKPFESKGFGSGVVVDVDGLILTNEHVVANAKSIEVTLASGEKLSAEVVDTSSDLDLAVLYVKTDKKLRVTGWANAELVKKGQYAIAFGNPFGLAKDSEPVMTVGHVSALGRSIKLPRIHTKKKEGEDRDADATEKDADKSKSKESADEADKSEKLITNLIQTDAAINPGNSGGPLVNIYGQIMGINVAIYSTTGGSQGIGFAVTYGESVRKLIRRARVSKAQAIRESRTEVKAEKTGNEASSVDPRAPLDVDKRVVALQNVFIEISKKVSPAVVSISVAIGEGRRSGHPLEEYLRHFYGEMPRYHFKREGLGSGVIIDGDGYILTNEHVVTGADKLEVILSSGEKYPGETISSDPKSDLAVVRIKAGKKLPTVEWAEITQVQKGQYAIAFGNPFGFADDPEPTMTVGHVSAVNRSLRTDPDHELTNLIQTDAAINPGNSGGPLVDISGKILGINTAIFSTSGGSQGIGFAIPLSASTKKLIEQLKVGKQIVYAWFGVRRPQTLTADLAEAFGLADKSGILVGAVAKDSPAQKAGVRKGDVILSVAGKSYSSARTFAKDVQGMAPGEKVEVKIFRDKQELPIQVTLGKKEVRSIASVSKLGPKAWRGMEVRDLKDEDVKKAGLKEKKGVVVSKIEPGNIADRANIKEGEIIDSMDRREVTNANTFDLLVAKKGVKEDALIHVGDRYVVLQGE